MAGTNWCCAPMPRRECGELEPGAGIPDSRGCVRRRGHGTGTGGAVRGRSVIGKLFYLMRRVPGEARGRKLVRDPVVRANGEALVRPRRGRAGQAASTRAAGAGPRVHTRPGPPAGPVADRRVSPPSRCDACQRMRARMGAGLARPPCSRQRAGSASCMPICGPATSWSSRAGSRRCSTGSSPRSAIPLEDLGWMLAKYWRFGAYELEAGGIGTREALLSGYEAASGQSDRPSRRRLLGGDGDRPLGGDRTDAGGAPFRGPRRARWSWRSPPTCCRCWSWTC